MKDAHILPAAILVTVLAVLANLLLTQQHPLVPASAPATEFSGERGMIMLEAFLAEGVPHPIGSEENRVVKRRIQAWLDEQGIAHEEQREWGCWDRWSTRCGFVENIIATIPGEVDGPYVALMAHYDSVLHSPGAGDDMAGVVAILEAARTLRATGGFRHPLLLIITDGEETGLHGAAAFFEHHPLADQVAVLLNVEGSGTRGHSQVLRTTEPNAWFMRLFSDGAAQPTGSSLGNEVFKRMPNDTDFSVSMAAGVPGIDFAFAAERNHYHTHNDSPANLDPRTIQHHGDNLMPLALRLTNADLTTEKDGGVVYNEAYGIWFQWSEGWSPVLLALSGLLLFAASLRTDTSVLRLALVSTLVPVLVFVSGGLLTHGSFALLDAVNGTTVSWPASLWPYRLVLFCATLLPAVLLARWLSGRFSIEALLLGGWWFYWLLTLLLVIFLSGGASVFLVLLVPAATLLALAAWLPVSEQQRTMLRLLTLVCAAASLNLTPLLEDTQGYRLLPTIWPWVALFAVTALAFVRGRWLPATAAALAGILVAGMVAGAALPLYSEFRPQHVNLLYVQDADEDQAVLRLQTNGAIPEAMQSVANFEEAERPYVPWTNREFTHLTDSDSAALPAPTLVVEESRETEDGREVTLRLASQRGAWRLALYLPPEAGARSLQIGGVELALEADDDEDDLGYTGVYLYGIQSRDALVTLQLDSTEPVNAYLADASPRLPEVARLVLDARPANATPVHRGDLATVYTRVSF